MFHQLCCKPEEWQLMMLICYLHPQTEMYYQTAHKRILLQASWSLWVEEWKKNKNSKRELIKNINLQPFRRWVSDFASPTSTDSAAACVCVVHTGGKTIPEGFHRVKVTMSAVSSQAGTRGGQGRSQPPLARVVLPAQHAQTIRSRLTIRSSELVTAPLQVLHYSAR